MEYDTHQSLGESKKNTKARGTVKFELGQRLGNPNEDSCEFSARMDGTGFHVLWESGVELAVEKSTCFQYVLPIFVNKAGDLA